MPILNFRQIHMPYCIQKNDDGTFVVLNREYQPLGLAEQGGFNTAGLPIAVKYPITKETARKLSYDGSDYMDRIHLYNDGCIPESSDKYMKGYLAKLRVLAKIKKKD